MPRKHSAEKKAEVIKRVFQHKEKYEKISSECGVSAGAISNWVKKYTDEQAGTTTPPPQPPAWNICSPPDDSTRKRARPVSDDQTLDQVFATQARPFFTILEGDDECLTLVVDSHDQLLTCKVIPKLYNHQNGMEMPFHAWSSFLLRKSLFVRYWSESTSTTSSHRDTATMQIVHQRLFVDIYRYEDHSTEDFASQSFQLLVKLQGKIYRIPSTHDLLSCPEFNAMIDPPYSYCPAGVGKFRFLKVFVKHIGFHEGRETINPQLQTLLSWHYLSVGVDDLSFCEMMRTGEITMNSFIDFLNLFSDQNNVEVNLIKRLLTTDGEYLNILVHKKKPEVVIGEPLDLVWDAGTNLLEMASAEVCELRRLGMLSLRSEHFDGGVLLL